MISLIRFSFHPVGPDVRDLRYRWTSEEHIFQFNNVLGLNLCFINFIKLNFLFFFAEDTLNHLQCIRESVVQMKNTDINVNYGAYGLIHAGVSFFFL